MACRARAAASRRRLIWPAGCPPPASQVRVWWPPTDDKSRTGFSGAFWPAAVTARGKAHFSVRYDNGDEERVHCENVFPYEVPLDFGQEIEELMVRGWYASAACNRCMHACMGTHAHACACGAVAVRSSSSMR